jgi:hypothetical protein
MPIPQRDDAPYVVIGIARRTPTIVEVWLRPLAAPMTFRRRMSTHRGLRAPG